MLQPREFAMIRLFNLSGLTTCKDLVGIFRGGLVLEFHIDRPGFAWVSFLGGGREFFTFITQNDVYLHNEKVKIRWDDRDYRPSNHVLRKVEYGASRNFIIRDGAPRLTEQMIRDDTEHIHGLVIVDVTFKDNDVYVSTNSVHHADYAKTCMTSRLSYKRLKMEWYPDECATRPMHA
ncbi:MAG: hypothetical protein M1822_002704 [Bathelium mastoideum]|nr:MAG: hypothetical protein M1822_002704 [Bathelium mastoideum]